jgi:hypothetical protein
MACTREQVFTALFALVAPLQAPADATKPLPALTPFRTVSRRVTLPGQGPAALDPLIQPALMMWEQPEHTEGGERGLRIRHWPVWFIIAFHNDNRELAGATILNPLIDAVEAALAPDDPIRNTLRLFQPAAGGQSIAMIEAGAIEGPLIKHTGDTSADGQGGAVILLDMVVP